MMKSKRSGFTLIEVLIGMSLLGLMMLLLFASLRICVQNWNAGEKKIVQVSQRAIVQNFFQSKLHATLPLNADFFEEQQFSFQGNAEQMQFVASMPASVGKLGIQLFTLSLQPGENNQGSELKVNIRPFFPKSETEEWDDESVVILKQIQALRFSYFGSDEIADEPVWQEEWLDKQILPKMVSVDIELTNGEVWPQVVTALTIEASDDGGVGGGGNPFDIISGKFPDHEKR
ncbi:MAG: prepilin-type N-terminal cleavage/methylation domain-containing protein [Methylococcaceae bacterium]|nr:prepilin-type N-terminal cleavage/methylation domain-containing protein [Methylococcaceae bacterium]